LNTVSYQEMDAALQGAGLGLTASELHGLITGLVCASASPSLEQLWPVLLEGENPGPDLAAAAGRLAGQTVAWLSEADMGFQPLLPDDEQPLAERTSELGLWCHGFLAGLGMARRHAEGEIQEQVKEVLQDFSQLSRAGFDEQDEDLEVADNAYAEIVEYVRVGVQLAFEYLARGQQTTSPTVH